MSLLPPVRRAVSSAAEARAFLVEAAWRGYGCVVLHPREYDLLDIALADGMIGSLGGLRVMREPFAVEGWAVALPVDGADAVARLVRAGDLGAARAVAVDAELAAGRVVDGVEPGEVDGG